MSLFTYQISAPDDSLATDAPHVPIKSALSFLIDTREKEMALIEVALLRLQEAEASRTKGGWLRTRQIAEKEMGGDFEQRKSENGGIYEHSNLSLNLPRRYARITKARAFNELLMTDPLLAITAEGEEDNVDDAALIQRVCADAITEADLKTHLRSGVWGACVRGETVFKVGWEKKVDRYEDMTRVLLDAEGKVVRDYENNPIVPGDNFSDEDENGKRQLLRDPNVVMTAGHKWTEQAQLVDRYSTTQDGLTARAIPLSDFICNVDARSIDEADCVAHIFQWTISDLAALLESSGDNNIEAQWALFRCAHAPQTSSPTLQELSSEDMSAPVQSINGLAKIYPAEIFLSVPLEMGRPAQEIVILIERTTKQPIYYDYLQNYSPTKNRPFGVIRMEPVHEHWYGMGFYELFSDRHEFCDLMLNRINFSSSISGSIRIQDSSATEEGVAGEDLEFGTDKVYHLVKDKKIAEVLKIIKVPDDSEAPTNLMNMILQVTQLEAGMTSAGDHGLSGLPSAGLATGIKALERVANTLLKDTFYDFVIGIEEILSLSVLHVMKYVSAKRVIRLVGEEKAARFERLREAGLLRYTTKLKLSATKDSEMLQANNQALQILMSFEQLPPENKLRWRPMFERLLRTLGIDDAGAMLGKPGELIPATTPIQNVEQVAPVKPPGTEPPPEPDDRTTPGRYNFTDPNNTILAKNVFNDPSEAASVLGQQLDQETAQFNAENNVTKT